MTVLQFDEASHTYTWDGMPVPNVTRILAPVVDYSSIPADRLEIARQKGVAVHRMVELDAKGDLDEASLPEWMRPALVQWRKFVADTGFTVARSEHRVFHPSFRYAGTLDLFGTMRDDSEAFIDVKRSFSAGAATGIQLAAYQQAMVEQEKCGRRAARYALRLNEAGPYRLEPFTSQSDWQTFLALLTVHRWREANLREVTA